MKRCAPVHQKPIRRLIRLSLAGTILATCLGGAGIAAEPPGHPPASAQFPTWLPTPPMQAQRPAEHVASLIKEVGQNDASFEVLVGQGRILTTKVDLAAQGRPSALVAVGDPSVLDFAVLSQRQIRVIGRQIGVTDLSVIGPDGVTYTFEVRVIADLHMLEERLKTLFPDACLKLTQVRDHLVVEGQARDTAQVARIMDTINAYMVSVYSSQLRKITEQQRGAQPVATPIQPLPQPGAPGAPPEVPPVVAIPEQTGLRIEGTVAKPVVVNLIKVPGSKQVLLKVRIAELNRTAFRQIGADWLATPNGAIIGTQIGGANIQGQSGATAVSSALTGFGQLLASPATTAFGVFENGDFAIMLSALRRNNLLKVLAEPNLVAMNGQTANFLVGGEFPVPVPQGAAGGVGANVTVQFKEFGVKLGFLPNIMDGDVIRLAVDPEVSTIDPALGTVLVPGGTPVPGLNTRKAHTVVELREGQTLAMAGLLQVALDGQTARIPGLGDLPILGPLFSNTTGRREEKELIILVTPYLVEAMNCNQVGALPGDEVGTPNDWEFYFLNRIEGRYGDWRSTTNYEKTVPMLHCILRLDAKNVQGPSGFCD